MPHLLEKLSESQYAYKKYFNKLKGIDQWNPLGDPKKRDMNPMDLVRADSPTWRNLKKDHKPPQ